MALSSWALFDGKEGKVFLRLKARCNPNFHWISVYNTAGAAFKHRSGRFFLCHCPGMLLEWTRTFQFQNNSESTNQRNYHTHGGMNGYQTMTVYLARRQLSEVRAAVSPVSLHFQNTFCLQLISKTQSVSFHRIEIKFHLYPKFKKKIPQSRSL